MPGHSYEIKTKGEGDMRSLCSRWRQASALSKFFVGAGIS